MKTKKLNNGLNIPLMGLGTSIRIAEDIVYYSIKDGIRLIDTAFNYKNEDKVGLGIAKAIREGIVKREDLFIIGKIRINQRDDPEKALKGTLERLQLYYIDMYIDHWPTGKNYEPIKPEDNFRMVPINEFWPKMEKLVEKGLTKSIGVCNYNAQALCNLLSFCKIKPVANEIEFHPYFCQKKLKEFCDKVNIAVISYYPLAHGNAARMYISDHNGELDILKEPLIIELAKKYSKICNMEINEGMIILNWHIQLGNIPIPGTCNIYRMKSNLKALEFKLEEGDIKKICSFEKKYMKKFCGCYNLFGINILA